VSLCLHPIDTIKVCIQTERYGSRNVLAVARRFVADRGARKLYSGVLTNLASSAPISAIYTSTYEAVKGLLLPRVGERTWVAHCVAGGMSSVATSAVYTPTECIKSRVQAGVYGSSFQALVSVVRKEGPLTLYRGLPAVLLRNVPQSVVKFFAYEQMKGAVRAASGREALEPHEILACGGVAGAMAAFFSTPFDTIKTRMQTQMGAQQVSLARTCSALLQQEGVKGLYRGILPRVTIYLTQGALFFASYELLKATYEAARAPPGSEGLTRHASPK